MTALLASPFSIPLNGLVIAVVDALNAVGYSTASPENTVGAQARTKPIDPSRVPQRGSLTDTTQLQIIVPTHVEDGGSALTSYGVEIDKGSGFVEV